MSPRSEAVIGEASFGDGCSGERKFLQSRALRRKFLEEGSFQKRSSGRGLLRGAVFSETSSSAEHLGRSLQCAFSIEYLAKMRLMNCGR